MIVLPCELVILHVYIIVYGAKSSFQESPNFPLLNWMKGKIYRLQVMSYWFSKVRALFGQSSFLDLNPPGPQQLYNVLTMTCYDQWSSWKYRTLLGKPGFPGINPAQPHLRPTHQAFAMTCRSPSSTLTNSTLDDVERHCVIEVCAAWLFKINEWSHRKRWVDFLFCSEGNV